MERPLRQALQEAESTGQADAVLADALNALGTFLWEEGRYVEAEPVLTRCLAVSEQLFAPEHSLVSARRRELAQAYQTLARYPEAEALILKAQQVHGKSYEPSRLALALDFRDMAELYRATKRWPEAESVLNWARELSGVLSAESHVQLAEIPRSQGHVAVDQQRFSEAAQFYAQADLLLERLPPDHALRMDLLEDRAYLAQMEGNYKGAEVMLKRLLKNRVRIGGPYHPRVAHVYYAWGLLARAWRGEKKAAAFFQKCRETQDRSLALYHPDKAQTLMRLADGLGRRKPGHAEDLYQEALELCERAYGPSHPQVAVCLNNLANLYYDKEYFREAEQCLTRSIAIYRGIYGEKNPEVVPSLYNLVALYDAQDQYDKVVALLKQVVDIVEQKSFPAVEMSQER